MLVKTVAREFYNSARAHLERLERLRLGPACLDTSNGADAHGLHDVQHLCQHLPLFQRLRTLELPGLGLDDGAAFLLLQACAEPTCTVRELDLSNNSIHHLDEALPGECRLTSLNLSENALGEFEDDADGEVSVGTGLTCGALGVLLSQYTSLRSLDLSHNEFHNAEVCLSCSFLTQLTHAFLTQLPHAQQGRAIALALPLCTNLSSLDLLNTHWDAPTHNAIAAAWRGPAGGLLL